MSQVTYIIRHGKSDLYKIGLASSVTGRLKALQTGSPVKLTLLFVIHQQRGYVVPAETRLHRLLCNRHVRGEWYNLPELRENAKKTILGWLKRVDLITLSTELTDSYILVRTAESPETIQARQVEVDTSLLLLFDVWRDDNSGLDVREIFARLPQYSQDEIAQSISKLVGLGRVGKRRPPGERPRFYLREEPLKNRVIYSLPREYYAQRT